MKVFFEIHQGLPREAPGDNASTRRAFAALTNLPAQPKILDIGCGPGSETLELARLTGGSITAVDIHQPFLETLKQRAQEQSVAERITTLNASMFLLDFEEQSFDIIWAEGAIYIIGFEQGLRSWKPFLKHQGYMAVSELSWLRSNPPQEIRDFWSNGYPGMRSISSNLGIIESVGYREVAYFVLPSSSWWNEYYHPLEARITQLRGKYRDNSEALLQLSQEQKEIDLYRQYSDYYGYVFYVMQLP